MVASAEPAFAARPARPIHVMVVGLRGIVDVEGGIETHARMIYPLLVRLGCRVEVVQRSPYFPGRRRSHWRGVELKYVWSPRRPGLETAVHSLLAVLYAALRRPDILHLHAIGPAFLAPLARLLGLRVVVTHHAEDFRREKWGRTAKAVLRTGERLGMRYANRPIVVSSVLQRDIEARYGVNAACIPNGAPRILRIESRASLPSFGLDAKRYVLCVARLEPTKRQSDLIDTFERADLGDWKLVLVGALTPASEYVDGLIERARADSRIVLTGFQSGRALRELYSHCGLFVLPSSMEGHPIVLLEALSYGVPTLASAIPENLAIPMPRNRYFPVGDTEALARLIEAAASGADPFSAEETRRTIRERYSWRRAAQLTRAVYESALGEA